MFIDGYFLLFQVRRASKTVDVGVWLSYVCLRLNVAQARKRGRAGLILYYQVLEHHNVNVLRVLEQPSTGT